MSDFGSFCAICGYTHNDINNVREHLLSKHYEYCLAQCNGDKEILRSWVNERYGVP